jgi:hypothetical protein
LLKESGKDKTAMVVRNEAKRVKSVVRFPAINTLLTPIM